MQELREKNWKAMDALDKTEKSCSDKVQKAVKETKVNQHKNFIAFVIKKKNAYFFFALFRFFSCKLSSLMLSKNCFQK